MIIVDFRSIILILLITLFGKFIEAGVFGNIRFRKRTEHDSKIMLFRFFPIYSNFSRFLNLQSQRKILFILQQKQVFDFEITHIKLKMYEIWIVLFCFLRSVVMRILNKRQSAKLKSEQSSVNKKEQSGNEQNQTETSQSEQKTQIMSLKARKREIEETIEQYNNPSTFAKYSKMQRQLTKLNNQICALEEEITKKAVQNQRQPSIQAPQSMKPSLLQMRKKQVQKIHGQIGNKQLWVKALINLGLIIGCSYVQSEELSLCVGYPLYAFCNESGRINGGWIFVISSVIFSY